MPKTASYLETTCVKDLANITSGIIQNVELVKILTLWQIEVDAVKVTPSWWQVSLQFVYSAMAHRNFKCNIQTEMNLVLFIHFSLGPVAHLTSQPKWNNYFVEVHWRQCLKSMYKYEQDRLHNHISCFICKDALSKNIKTRQLC